MLKRLAIIFILAVALVGAGRVWPEQQEQVLLGIAALRDDASALFSSYQPVIKIVDPADLGGGEDGLRITREGRGRHVTALAAADVIDATNRERIKEGLAPLQVNGLLSESATIKTRDMIDQQYFEHDSPQGLGVSDLGAEVGYHYVIMGENLALGDFESATDLVDAWMGSPGHRENILNPLYQEIGIAVMRGDYQDHEVWYAVQHFGTSRSVCPAINDTNKRSIDMANGELARIRAELDELKARIEGEGPSHPQYADWVQRFNFLVDEYNELLESSQQQIELYNRQVSSFNSCIKKYQKSSS